MVDRQVRISITLRNEASPSKRVHKFARQKGQFYKKLKKRVTTVNLQILTKGFKYISGLNKVRNYIFLKEPKNLAWEYGVMALEKISN